MDRAKVPPRTAIPALRSPMSLKVKSGRKSVMSLNELIRPVKCSLRLRGNFTRSRATVALPGRRSSWRYCSLKRESNSPRRGRSKVNTRWNSGRKSARLCALRVRCACARRSSSPAPAHRAPRRRNAGAARQRSGHQKALRVRQEHQVARAGRARGDQP